MSKRNLKIRKIKLKGLPHGKFQWIVKIQTKPGRIESLDSNNKSIEPLRKVLDSSSGSSRFCYKLNWDDDRVFYQIYLTNSSDVLLLKLCYPDMIHKIYKIETYD